MSSGQKGREILLINQSIIITKDGDNPSLYSQKIPKEKPNRSVIGLERKSESQ